MRFKKDLLQTVSLSFAFALATVGQVSVGQEKSTDPKSAETKPGDSNGIVDLTAKQSEIANRYKILEQKLFTLHEFEMAENPDRANLLKRAFEQSQENLTLKELETVLPLIEKKNLAGAKTKQLEALQDLKLLLELLQSEDRSKRIRDEEERIKEYIEEVDRLLRIQKGLRSQAENGVDEKKLSKSQEKTAKRTNDLSKQLEQDGQSESDSQNSESENSENNNQSPENGEQKNPDGEMNPMENGQNQDPKNGEQQNPENGGEKKESGEPKNGEDKKGENKEGEPKNGDMKDPMTDQKTPMENGQAQNNENGQNSETMPKSGENSQSQQGEPMKNNGENKPMQSGDNKESGKQAGEKEGEKEKDQQEQKPMDSNGDEKKPSEDQKPMDQNGDKKESDPNSQKSENSEQSQKSQSQNQSQNQQQNQNQNESQQNQNEQQNQQQQEQEKNPVLKKLKSAEENMKKAQLKLEEAKRNESIEEMKKAEQELAQAKKDLEEILRQLREEEMERTLAALEGRFRKMLEAEIRIYEATKRLDQVVPEQRKSEFFVQSGKLSLEQREVSREADRALTLLLDEGSSLAFPETVEQMRDDMLQVSQMLSEAKVNRLTQELEEEIIDALDYMIAAIVQAQEELEEQKEQQEQQQQQQQQQQQMDPNEMPLVNQIQELKMIKGLQERINKRHGRYSRLLDDPEDIVGETNDPDIQAALLKLSERQKELQKLTRDIVLGKDK